MDVRTSWGGAWEELLTGALVPGVEDDPAEDGPDARLLEADDAVEVADTVDDEEPMVLVLPPPLEDARLVELPLGELAALLFCDVLVEVELSPAFMELPGLMLVLLPTPPPLELPVPRGTHRPSAHVSRLVHCASELQAATQRSPSST